MPATDTRVRFHLSLNVADLAKSIAFYRTLLGVEPAKVRADYAKFEPDEPPLVLSLEPTPRPAGGPLNHLGLRMPDAKSLVAVQERLERAGMRTRREEGVECCYAKQTKFWAHDPDGTLCEVYTLDGDLEYRGDGQTREAVATPAGAPTVWEHRLGEPFPACVPLADESADEVRLRGSFNVQLDAAEQQRIIAEALRMLKPGGRLFLHTLVAERPTAGEPDLPGPASAVRYTPPEGETVGLLEAAGLTGVRLVKFDAKPCFVRDGVPMREQQLEGYKPAPATTGELEVLYKGPFAQVVDETGRAYPRGKRVRVSASVADRLRDPALSAQFVVFEPVAATAGSCGSESTPQLVMLR
jgi:catechol 2,3-dioxygenase-like lactoylglutathione lyase family enzyme